MATQSRKNVYEVLYEFGKVGWQSLGIWPVNRAILEEELSRAAGQIFLEFPDLRRAARFDGNLTTQTIVAAHWVSQAMPVVEVPPLAAAALCASSAHESVMEDFHAPWDSFAIELSEPLIMVKNRVGDLEHVHTIVCNYSRGIEGTSGWSYLGYADSITIRQSVLTPERLFSEETEIVNEASPVVALEDVDLRAMTLCRALIRGVLLRCANPSQKEAYRKKMGTSTKARKARQEKYGGLPDFDRYVITDRIDIDARPVIRDYAHGTRPSPSVRTLVCGHHRRQAYGPQNSQRKMIWIQPHWRGSEGFPIATKSYRVQP